MQKTEFTAREIAKAVNMTRLEVEQLIKELSSQEGVTTVEHKGFSLGRYGSAPGPVVVERIFRVNGILMKYYSVNLPGLMALVRLCDPEKGQKLKNLVVKENAAPSPDIAARVYQPAEVNTPGRYVTIGDFAKIYYREFSLGRNTLMKKLREKRFLQPNNIPYQRYIQNGFFVVETNPYTARGDNSRIGFTTKLTHKGVRWLREELTKMC